MQMNNQYPNSIYNPQIQPYFQYGNYGGNQYQQQRFEPQQQFQQQMQPVQQSQSTFINGKIVPSVDVINANDVPMDGSVAIFPKQDMSEIYAKQWNADGTIRTVVFKPALNEQDNNLSNDKEKAVLEALEDVRSGFDEKINELVSEICKLEKKICDTPTNRTTKSKNSTT